MKLRCPLKISLLRKNEHSTAPLDHVQYDLSRLSAKAWSIKTREITREMEEQVIESNLDFLFHLSDTVDNWDVWKQ